MNEKKQYEKASIELVSFASDDVISTSGGNGNEVFDQDGWA